MIRAAVQYAGPIKHLIEAGIPVEQAIHQQAPELGAAIKELVAVSTPVDHSSPKPPAAAGSPAQARHLTHEEATVAVSKAIFTPQHIEPHEQAWMDRASSTSFG